MTDSSAAFETIRTEMFAFLAEATRSEFVRTSSIVINSDSTVFVSLLFDNMSAAGCFEVSGGLTAMRCDGVKRQMIGGGRPTEKVLLTFHATRKEG